MFVFVVRSLLVVLASRSTMEHTPPVRPADLLPMSEFRGKTLSQLDWRVRQDRVLANGVRMLIGNFSTGSFASLNVHKVPHRIENVVAAAAIYLPPSDTQHPPKAGIVQNMLISKSVISQSDDPNDRAKLVRGLGVPVVSHGAYPALWKDFGFVGENYLSAESGMVELMAHPCNYTSPKDLLFGNLAYKLAAMNMLAGSLLQAVVTQHHREWEVKNLAVTGGSKGGSAAWITAAADERVTVLRASGFQLEDLDQLDQYETSWNCSFECDAGTGTGQNGTSLVLYSRWQQHTPTGRAFYNLLNVPSSADTLSKRIKFALLAGDVAMCNMHDGHHFPLGIETPFLDALTVPHWYDRCTACPLCAVCPHARPKNIFNILYPVGALLVDGPGVAAMLPSVLAANATASTTTRQLCVGASVRLAKGVSVEDHVVNIYYNFSPDRVYNRPSQPAWKDLNMTAAAPSAGLPSGMQFTAPCVQVPPEHEVAWFVKVQAQQRGMMDLIQPLPNATNTQTNTNPLTDRSVPVTDASPVRFAFRRDRTQGNCHIHTPQWCK